MRLIANIALAVMCLTTSVIPTIAAETSMRDRPHANDLGIWKSYSPRGLHGEFHNYDPVGLMAGTDSPGLLHQLDGPTRETYAQQRYARVFCERKTYAGKAAAASKMKEEALRSKDRPHVTPAYLRGHFKP
jgi:hypothetical protein